MEKHHGSRKMWLIFGGLGVLVLLILGTLAYAAYAFWGLYMSPAKELKDGFSPELKAAMRECYQLTIPDDAVLIKGEVTNHPQDAYVMLYFECPNDGASDTMSYLHAKLGLDESTYGPIVKGDELQTDRLSEFGGRMTYTVNYLDKPFTTLSFSIRGNTVRFRFCGWRPNTAFYQLSRRPPIRPEAGRLRPQREAM